jgi:hypothetical protein
VSRINVERSHNEAVHAHARVAVRHRRVVAGVRQSRVAQPGGCRCPVEWFRTVCPLPAGARDVAGVPVQAAAGPVMPHRGPRVSMGRRFPRVALVPYRASRPRMAAP